MTTDDRKAFREARDAGLRKRHEQRLARRTNPGEPVTPSKYRKKPVVIEASQFDGSVESANRLLGWIGSNGGEAARLHPADPMRGLIVSTLEGSMRADVSDWIIRGVKGEFYPCKPDIFEATYEPVVDQ